MKYLRITKRIVGWGCFFFTCLVFFMYLINNIMQLEGSAVLDFIAIAKLFVYSIALSSANILFSLNRLNAVLRLLIHFIITSCVFYICFIVWSGFINNGKMTLTALVLYVILYSIAMLIAFAFGLFKREKLSEKKSYTKLFDIEKDK